jgi:hypothetical protein
MRRLLAVASTSLRAGKMKSVQRLQVRPMQLAL